MPKSRQRIVLKFGSGILAAARGVSLDGKQFKRLAAEVAALVKAGHECCIVSSGAVAAGLGVLGLKERPEGLAARQACAAIGQSKLMQMYATHFAGHGLNVAQLLLTHGDLDSRLRHANARNTLACLFERRTVVPIINENDSVAVEELRFGDNDRLSAEVAMLADADLLILLTSVDGLLDAEGKLVPLVDDIDGVAKLARQEKGKFSVGGMVSKLQAVKLATEAGIPTYVVSGRKPGRIAAAAAGRRVGTRFVAKGKAISAKGPN
ncbi:MAG: glutamate 5-kinase [Chthoniobacter sp.]|jgi:glutamate 5-kinase|nr:glutamate 5-kinase [Chthoniobacter sp.]